MKVCVVLPAWSWFVLLACVTPQPAAAQATRADSAAVILDAAARFRAEGRDDVSSALYQYLLEWYGNTPAADEARRLLARSPVAATTRGGRVELHVWTTVYGLWLGVAVPAALGADGPEPYGVGLLVGGPVGFLSGLGLARSRELSDGQARAITFGGTWGTWQGWGWATVLDWGEVNYAECGPLGACPEDRSTERRFAGMVAGGLVGVATGALLSRKQITPGVATAVNFGALWGSWFGVATAVLADAADDKLIGTTLIGGDAGLLGTALLAPGWGISRNRARLISIAGVVGGLAGAGIDLIAQPENDKTLVAIPLAGSVAGLTLGAITTRDYDARRSPGGDATGMALLQLRRGRLSFGSPLPVPTLVPVERNGRRSHEMAAGITLFDGRF